MQGNDVFTVHMKRFSNQFGLVLFHKFLFLNFEHVASHWVGEKGKEKTQRVRIILIEANISTGTITDHLNGVAQGSAQNAISICIVAQ